MAIKILNGVYEGMAQLALYTDSGIYRLSDIPQGGGGGINTIEELLAAGEAGLERLRSLQEVVEKGGLVAAKEPEQWLSPVPGTGKVLCVGLNYRPHIAESGMEIPAHPVLFNKFGDSLAGHGSIVHPPVAACQMDYEAELVMVMGRTCRNVSQEDALDYVLGYCNGNDLSARDLQFQTSQWLLGKALGGFGPLGPYLVTADEITDPSNLHIVCRRNNAVVQESHTSQMIFPCRYLVSYLSHYMTLQPGDVIFTGTPEGVILGQPEETRRWLEPGEMVSVEISGLGELKTTLGESL